MSLRAEAVRNIALLHEPITKEAVLEEMRRLLDAVRFHRQLGPGWSTVEDK